MRVVIAEDSVLLRAGLTRLLTDAGEDVVAAVGDADLLLTAVERHRPDLAIVDVRMPPTQTDEGIRAAVEIRSRWPEVAILVLSQYVEERYATELLAGDSAGLGYLLKDRVADVREFVEAARRVGAGGTALDPDVIAQLLARSRRQDPLERLSPREARGARPHGRRPFERGDRPVARGERRRGREARPQHLHEARSHGRRIRSPPRARGPPLDGCVMSALTQSRTVRYAWIAFGAVFVVAALFWGLVQAVSLLAFDRQRFEQSFDVAIAGTITKIDVDNGAGSVRLVGTDADSIQIDGKVVRGINEPSHTERVVGETLEIDASCSTLGNFCSVDYVVQVPRDVDVKVRASGGGVRVFGIHGALDIGSSGGGLHIEGATGDLHLRSSGGGITATELESAHADASSSGGGVRLEFVDEPTAVNASSSGGSVTVVVPRTDADYRVDASSSGGGVDTEVTRNDNSERAITVHSSGGGVTVRYPPGPE